MEMSLLPQTTGRAAPPHHTFQLAQEALISHVGLPNSVMAGCEITPQQNNITDWCTPNMLPVSEGNTEGASQCPLNRGFSRLHHHLKPLSVPRARQTSSMPRGWFWA